MEMRINYDRVFIDIPVALRSLDGIWGEPIMGIKTVSLECLIRFNAAINKHIFCCKSKFLNGTIEFLVVQLETNCRMSRITGPQKEILFGVEGAFAFFLHEVDNGAILYRNIQVNI